MMASIQYTNSARLGDLLEGMISPLSGDAAELAVTGVQLDSRRILPGDLFLACKGYHQDGRDFIVKAIEAGACAIVCDRPSDEKIRYFSTGKSVTGKTVSGEVKNIPIIEVEDLPLHVSEIAGRFCNNPSKVLPVIAVTGTNGKTSCTQLIAQYMGLLGERCAVIGTMGVGVDGVLDSTSNTTPDAVSLQYSLARWLADGVDAVAMEASSHGLAQGRLSALEIQCAVFTNLSRDHLDYHGSMQAYANAKTILFQQRGLKLVVLNADDVFSKKLENVVPGDVQIIRYSAKGASHCGNKVDVWLESVKYHANGVSGLLHSPWGSAEISSPLLGEFNVSNLLAVVAVLGESGVSIPDLAAATNSLKTIAGRMEHLETKEPSDINVIVDYAHTPDALEQALKAVRLHADGKVWCVFGCGGDRDQGKRPKMGSIVERNSDYVIVTSDNPRHEAAEQIIDEILVGVQRPSMVEVDRAKAIEFAIMHANANDSILLAGKGHEQYQQLGDEKIPFDDFKQARLALIKRRESQLKEGGK